MPAALPDFGFFAGERVIAIDFVAVFGEPLQHIHAHASQADHCEFHRFPL